MCPGCRISKHPFVKTIRLPCLLQFLNPSDQGISFEDFLHVTLFSHRLRIASASLVLRLAAERIISCRFESLVQRDAQADSPSTNRPENLDGPLSGLQDRLPRRTSCRDPTSFFWRPAQQSGCFSISGSPLQNQDLVFEDRRQSGGAAFLEIRPAGRAAQTLPVKVLLIHGLCASKSAMRQMAAEIARWGSDCYLIDLPGHGDSTEHFSLQASDRAIDRAVQALLSESNASLIRRLLSLLDTPSGRGPRSAPPNAIHELLR